MKNFEDIICQLVCTSVYDTTDESKYCIGTVDEFTDNGTVNWHYNHIIEVNKNGTFINKIQCMSAYDEDNDKYQFVFDSIISEKYDDDEKFLDFAEDFQRIGAMSIFLVYRFETNIFVMHIPAMALFEDSSKETIVNLAIYDMGYIVRTNYRTVLSSQDDFTHDLQMMFIFLYFREKYLMRLAELNSILRKTLDSDRTKSLIAYYRDVYNAANR